MVAAFGDDNTLVIDVDRLFVNWRSTGRAQVVAG